MLYAGPDVATSTQQPAGKLQTRNKKVTKSIWTTSFPKTHFFQSVPEWLGGQHSVIPNFRDLKDKIEQTINTTRHNQEII